MELYVRALQRAVGSDRGTLSTHRLCQHTSLPTDSANCTDSIRDDPKMILGSYVKRAQTISFVEREFERLGLGHRTMVSHNVHTDLNRVRSRSLSPRYSLGGSGSWPFFPALSLDRLLFLLY